MSKICFFVGSMKLGGTEKVALILFKKLFDQGVNIRLLLLNDKIDFHIEDKYYQNIDIIGANKISKKRIKPLIVWFNLFKYLRKNKPEKVISFSLGLNLLLVSQFYNQSYLTIDANIFIYTRKLYRRYLQKYIALSPFVKKIIVPSEGLLNACHEYFISKDKLVQIDNPIDVDEILLLRDESIDDYPILDENKFIVSAGRLSSSKGFYQLIEKFDDCISDKSIKLVILGEGEQRKSLEKLIKERDLEDKVILAGFQKNPYKFISKSKYFILNSTHESFGNVIIEAFACGVPVVSNDCDFGPRHIIKSEYNGLLYNNKNDVEICHAMNLLIDKKEFSEKLNKNVKESLYKYESDFILKNWKTAVIGN
ncbi:glycosyltransferase [Marivirga sp.]|uniref:glycosyltransferase n=1 Tax=Marivirga sp. TaxID=2018662 RepID=UPI003DA6EA03